MSPRNGGASSALESDNVFSTSRYGPEKALDGDSATCWVEGSPGPGIGESYVLALERYPEALGFNNGHAKSPNLFDMNHRVKELTIRVFAGVMVSGFASERVIFYDALPISEERDIHLSDTLEAQKVKLPFIQGRIIRQMAGFRNSDEITSWNFPQAREMGIGGNEGLSLYFRYLIRMEISETYRGSKW